MKTVIRIKPTLTPHKDRFNGRLAINKPTHKQAKDKIITLTEILNSKAVLIEEINLLIIESNSYLYSINSHLSDIIKPKADPVIKISTFMQFKENHKTIEDKVSDYTQKIAEKIKTLAIHINEYTDALSDAKELQQYIYSDTKFFKDVQGIITFNELRILEMKNLDVQALKCLETLEQFKTTTLYHLRESTEFELLKKNPKEIIENEISQIENRVEKYRVILIKVSLLFSIIGIYNYLAYNYYINSNWSTNVYADTNNIPSILINIFPKLHAAATIISMFMLLVGVLRLVKRGNPSSGFLMIVFAALLNFTFYVIYGIFGIESKPQVVSIEHVNFTVEFFNFGSYGTNIISFVCLIAINFIFYLKFKNIKNIHRKNQIVNPFGF